MGELFYNKILGTWLGEIYIAGFSEEISLLTIDSYNNFIDQIHNRFNAKPIYNQNSFNAGIEQVQSYLRGGLKEFSTEVNLESCTSFQRSVLEYTKCIVYGQTETYGTVAKAINLPNSARAVGQALRKNPVPLIIPCHRVIGADGTMRGYAGPSGIDMKRQLLDFEKRSLI